MSSIIRGLPNLHSHAFQRAMAGLAERRAGATDDFWIWRETMYRLALRITPDQMEAIAAMAYVEMLEAGFTHVGEFQYLHHDVDGQPYGDIGEMSARLAAAAERTGIGLTLLPVFYAHSSFGGAPPLPEQRRFISSLDGYARLVERCRQLGPTGVAPHSLRAVTPQELARVVEIGEGGPVHVHVSEQTAEVEACLAWSGSRPVQWLLDHAPVDARWCLVHATHVEPAEIEGIAASGATVALCPITEANLGDGIFPLVSFLAAGGRFGVGTDSNVRISAGGELELLEYGQRLSRRARNVVQRGTMSTGRTLYEEARAGAAALGDPTPDDQVSLAADAADLDTALDQWIFAGVTIDTVHVNGKKVVEGGRHVAREEVAAAFANVRTTLMSGPPW